MVVSYSHSRTYASNGPLVHERLRLGAAQQERLSNFQIDYSFKTVRYSIPTVAKWVRSEPVTGAPQL